MDVNFKFKCGHISSLCYGTLKAAERDREKWSKMLCSMCSNEARFMQLKEKLSHKSKPVIISYARIS